jgi:hypothetical protein
MAENIVILEYGFYEERSRFGRLRRVPDGTGFLHVDLDGIIRSAVIPAEIFPAVSNAVMAFRLQISELQAERDRWRSIADGFADAGTRSTAYDIALEDYEEAICDITNEQVDQILKVIRETHRG